MALTRTIKLKLTIQDVDNPLCEFEYDGGETPTADSPGFPPLLVYDVIDPVTQTILTPNQDEHKEIIAAIEEHIERIYKDC